MTSSRQVLVIDDELERLQQLASELHLQLPGVKIQTWQPIAGEDPVRRFLDALEEPTGLIVTDHDLTKGVIGLLGSNITAWAQERFIPVCNFSRQPQRRLPRESNFFELRVPAGDETARAKYIARIFLGFRGLNEYIVAHHDGTAPGSALLAGAMGRAELQDELAPYITSVGSASSALMRSLREADELPTGEAQAEFHTFILGHVLVNAVLEFAGPILSRRTLAAYCAFSDAIEDDLAELFKEAEYAGPFSASGMYFLRDAVDDRIDELQSTEADSTIKQEVLEVDEYNHAVVQQALGGIEAKHGCERCGGTRGGLWCPFTQRAVCNREDCSVSSAEWIPRGATLCRVERDYFDEWAPLLLGG